MRRHIFIVSALSFMFVLQSVHARAQTTAVGPYLATPARDQKLQCDSLATCPRFVVLSNWNSEAVLDRETGLVCGCAARKLGQYAAREVGHLKDVHSTRL
jgi:hypothetical protein